MSRLHAPALAAVLFVVGPAAFAAEPAPPGCRWQQASGGQILACKDSQGYWRRQGDDEIVGYDPPKSKPRPQPAAPPPQRPEPEPSAALQAAPAAPAEMPDIVRADETPPAAEEAALTAQVSPTPPEPPTEPAPPRSPLEAFFRWLLQLWRGFTTWLGSLF